MAELLDLKAQHPDAKLVVGNTEIGKGAWGPLGIAGLFLTLYFLPTLPPLPTPPLSMYCLTENLLKSSGHMDSQDIGEAWFSPFLCVPGKVLILCTGWYNTSEGCLNIRCDPYTC